MKAALGLLASASLLAGAHAHARARAPSPRGGALASAPADMTASSGVALTVSPALLLRDVENVTLSWTGFADVNVTTDWFGMVCSGGATDLESELDWVKVGEAGPNPVSGSLSFTVFRAVCAYEWRLFRGKQPLWPSGALLAVSNSVSWAGDALAPFHVHAAFGGEDAQRSMFVSFTTSQAGARVAVMVGTRSGVYDLPNATDVESTTYGAGDLCNANANVSSPAFWVWPGVFHHVLVRGLQPGTRYFALPVADDVHVGPEATFVTGAELGADVRVSFVGFGDMAATQYDYVLENGSSVDEPASTGPGAVGTARRVSELMGSGDADAPTFVLHFGAFGLRCACSSPLQSPLNFFSRLYSPFSPLFGSKGDLGYGTGRVRLWELWMSMMTQMGKLGAYMVSLGNHGESCLSSTRPPGEI